MDMEKSKGMKKNSIIKKMLLFSLSFQSSRLETSKLDVISLSKSKSWHCSTSKKSQENDQYKKTRQNNKVAQKGCFSVYVGPEKQRFVIKAKYANHPLFKMLLEDAELEYGYTSEGPLLLPCEVDLFYKVLAEMDCKDQEFHSSGGGFAYYGSCSPFSPARFLRNGRPYGLLAEPRLIKMNKL
ncbi:hypothetical protein ACH5RR_025262 [Cinchona calisaya]|uniref:Uncharacterized protein n=1 Tax=Cinchona calisaya TaxID=153742 RepID=A0ABD2Z2H8_9GENT